MDIKAVLEHTQQLNGAVSALSHIDAILTELRNKPNIGSEVTVKIQITDYVIKVDFMDDKHLLEVLHKECRNRIEELKKVISDDLYPTQPAEHAR